MTQNDVIRAICTLASFGLLTALLLVINTAKLHRGRQALMPPIALAASVAGIVALLHYYELIEAVCARYPFFEGAEITVMNLALLLAVIVIKAILCPIISALWKSNERMEQTSSRYYEFDSHYEEWFLINNWTGLRSLLKWLAIAMACIAAAFCLLTWLEGRSSHWWIIWFPAAAAAVACEIYSYLNGKTIEEFYHEVDGTNADSRRIKNYYKIREIYEKLFPGELLASHTGAEFMEKKGATQLLQTLSISDDPVDRRVAQYFLTYGEQTEFDGDCIEATNKLMRGQNVVFFDPFYRDLSKYLTFPIINTLLSGKTCLVICGRTSTSKDAVDWLRDVLKEYTQVRALWPVKELSKSQQECDVGILGFRQLYDVDVLAENKVFFDRVGFVLLLEPSVMVNTGQIGISVICEEISRFGQQPVYCICDRYTDGIIDTMSHLLKAEITQAVAAPVPRSIYTGMGWNSEGDYLRQELFDKQTAYLGNGLELAAVAVKNQVSTVTWYGEKKAPLRDIRWIAGQYYATICKYMGIPIQQESLYDRVQFKPNLWSNEKAKDQFIIAEDEFCNLFSTMRAFLSRGTEHAFVNVLSENYLLRDYMRCNQRLFMSNPNAVPSLIPDYAKTERNTILKLVIKMAIEPVSEEMIRDELLLAGCSVHDVLDTLSVLLKKYTFTDGSILDIRSAAEDERLINSHKTNFFSISRGKFDELFDNSIKNAYYIVEDEKRDEEYIDAKMFGHVPQTILPGQFVTYDGKYYEVKTVSPESGIILRRASDLYGGRRSYRQIRIYRFEQQDQMDIIYSRTVMDVETSIMCCDFSVVTSGYLDMPDMHDLRMARLISYQGDPMMDGFTRKYHNKNVLRIRLPDTNDKIRFTLCLLLSEVFRSIFPDAWQYLAVLASRPDDIEGVLNYSVYSVEGKIDDEYIYIVEDSDIDLGLLDAVNRNFPQLLEIVADYLDWHFEKMREPEKDDPLPEKVQMPEVEKKRNLFLRMADYLRKLLAKKEPEVEIEVPKEEETATAEDNQSADDLNQQDETTEQTPAEEYSLDASVDEREDTPLQPTIQEEPAAPTDSTEKEDTTELSTDEKTDEEPANDLQPEDQIEEGSEEDADIIHVEGTDIFDDDGMPEDNLWLEESFTLIGITPIRKTRYQTECYLKFGFNEIDARLRVEDVHKYLHARGYCNNYLTLARKRELSGENLDLAAENHCDFCGVPLTGVSYEVLNDGRTRCNDCSSSAITDVEELRRVFYRVLELMEMFYAVDYHFPISVKMVDARVIAKGAGYVFRPSTQVTSRVLGYAQKKNGKYSILMENGSPRLVTIDTMVHELTHIWQYINWNSGQVKSVYAMHEPACSKIAEDIVYEGMAVWAAVQYLYQIGETYFASLQEKLYMHSNDVYGLGFKLYCEQYPLIKDMTLIRYTPFQNFPTVEPEKVREAVRSQCKNEECKC